LGFGGSAGLDELDVDHRGVVAAARPELEDAGVAAGALGEALGQVKEDFLHEVDALALVVGTRDDAKAREEGGDEALDVETASFVLGGELALGGVGDGAEALGFGDEALGDTAEFFGLGLGGLDALVGDEVGRKVAEHGPAMAGVTAEFAACVEVAHGKFSSR
jgi:hypothetical protein